METVELFIVRALSNVMTLIPDAVRQTSIVSVVLHHLFFRDSEARSVLVAAAGQLEYILDVFASKGCVAVVGGDRWTHVLEHHNVVFRHLESKLRLLISRRQLFIN